MTLLGSQPERDSRAPASSTWHAVTVAGTATLQSQVLIGAGVVHAFTLRRDGQPTGAKPDLADVHPPPERLCTALSCEASLLTGMEQVHGSRVAVVEPGMVGRCIDGVDALVVNRPGVPLLAVSADCPLIVVCDPQSGVLGLAHAGWRGIVSGVVGGLVRTLVDRFGCLAEEMVAAVSPSAGPCCYRVGDQVVARAAQALPDVERHFQRRLGSTFFDLRSACAAQLHLAGIDAKHIDPAGECTICDDRFFSYRRDGPNTGHAGLIAALSEGCGDLTRQDTVSTLSRRLQEGGSRERQDLDNPEARLHSTSAHRPDDPALRGQGPDHPGHEAHADIQGTG